MSIFQSLFKKLLQSLTEVNAVSFGYFLRTRSVYMFNKPTILSILLALGLSCSSVLAKPTDQAKSVSQTQQQSAVLDINSADASALSSLPGIGIRKAEAIVEYRKKMGRFKTTTELLEVKGIGKGILAKLEGKIRV